MNEDSLVGLIEINQGFVSPVQELVCELVNRRVFNGELIRKTDFYRCNNINFSEGNLIYNQLLGLLFPEVSRVDNPCFYVKSVIDNVGVNCDLTCRAYEIASQFYNNNRTASFDPLRLAACAVYIAEHENNSLGHSYEFYNKVINGNIDRSVRQLKKIFNF